MEKVSESSAKTLFRTATVEKATKYILSYLKIFFLLNFFLLMMFASHNPDLVFSPRDYVQIDYLQLYTISVLVLAALFNSLLFSWDEGDSSRQEEEVDSPRHQDD